MSCVFQKRENSSGDVIMMQSELPQLGLQESFFNRKPVLQTWDSLKNINHAGRVKESGTATQNLRSQNYFSTYKSYLTQVRMMMVVTDT